MKHKLKKLVAYQFYVCHLYSPNVVSQKAIDLLLLTVCVYDKIGDLFKIYSSKFVNGHLVPA